MNEPIKFHDAMLGRDYVVSTGSLESIKMPTPYLTILLRSLGVVILLGGLWAVFG